MKKRNPFLIRLKNHVNNHRKDSTIFTTLFNSSHHSSLFPSSLLFDSTTAAASVNKEKASKAVSKVIMGGLPITNFIAKWDILRITNVMES